MGRWGVVLGWLALLGLPTGIAAQDGQALFVSSRNTSSVKAFDAASGEFLGDFVKPGAGGLNATQEVAFGPDGDLFVSGRGNTSILRFDGRTGEFIGDFTSGYELDNPTKMTFSQDGRLYVSQWGERQATVARFDATTGEFIDEVTPPLVQGMAHAWDEEGRLYVASYGSKDVKRFTADGEPIDVFAAPEHLLSAVNLWFGQGGDLFVADWEAGAVRRFNGETGVFMGDFFTGLAKLEGVALGPDGTLFACDWERNEIHRFDPTTGAHLGVFTAAGDMKQPNGLAFGPRPDLR